MKVKKGAKSEFYPQTCNSDKTNVIFRAKKGVSMNVVETYHI